MSNPLALVAAGAQAAQGVGSLYSGFAGRKSAKKKEKRARRRMREEEARVGNQINVGNALGGIQGDLATMRVNQGLLPIQREVQESRRRSRDIKRQGRMQMFQDYLGIMSNVAGGLSGAGIGKTG